MTYSLRRRGTLEYNLTVLKLLTFKTICTGCPINKWLTIYVADQYTGDSNRQILLVNSHCTDSFL